MMNNTIKSSQVLLICIVLATVTLAVFWQVKDHEFINYDDTLYVTENPQVQAGFTITNQIRESVRRVLNLHLLRNKNENPKSNLPQRKK